jgi:hypothetical protein
MIWVIADCTSSSMRARIPASAESTDFWIRSSSGIVLIDRTRAAAGGRTNPAGGRHAQYAGISVRPCIIGTAIGEVKVRMA